MYPEHKFKAMSAANQAKRMAELLRTIILQIGNDIKQTKREYEAYADYMNLPEEERLEGKNQAQYIDLYKNFRMRAGLSFERDIYLQQEPGDTQTAREEKLPYSVLVHNLRSAFNVGSVIRSVDCFGLESVNLSGYSPGAEHVTVRSAARGCERWIPIERFDSPLSCIQKFREAGYTIIALETGENIPDIREVDWPEKGLILLGNEELGIAPELMQEADLKIMIPMCGRKASMNVAGAFAITAFSIRGAYGK